jgi:hypothetical protein
MRKRERGNDDEKKKKKLNFLEVYYQNTSRFQYKSRYVFVEDHAKAYANLADIPPSIQPSLL